MKRIVEDKEGGLISLMGKRVTFFCVNYIYTGVLVGFDDACAELEDSAIVYDTGSFELSEYQDEQKLPMKTHFINLALVESFGAKNVE